MKLRLVTICLLIALAALTSSAQTPTTGDPPPKLPEPVIKLNSIDGHPYDIAEMRGKVVLVSFGATWCAPCTNELHALLELAQEYKDQPVKFLWVTIESEAEASNAVVNRYAKTRRLTFPVLRDPRGFAFNQFSPRVRLPMIVFFDKDGHAAGPPHFGMSSEPGPYKDAMRQRLNKLLGIGHSEVD